MNRITKVTSRYDGPLAGECVYEGEVCRFECAAMGDLYASDMEKYHCDFLWTPRLFKVHRKQGPMIVNMDDFEREAAWWNGARRMNLSDDDSLLLLQLRQMAAGKHDDLSLADQAADRIEELLKAKELKAGGVIEEEPSGCHKTPEQIAHKRRKLLSLLRV